MSQFLKSYKKQDNKTWHKNFNPKCFESLTENSA